MEQCLARLLFYQSQTPPCYLCHLVTTQASTPSSWQCVHPHLQELCIQSPGGIRGDWETPCLPPPPAQALLPTGEGSPSPYLFCTHSAIYSLWQHSNHKALCLLPGMGLLPTPTEPGPQAQQAPPTLAHCPFLQERKLSTPPPKDTWARGWLYPQAPANPTSGLQRNQVSKQQCLQWAVLKFQGGYTLVERSPQCSPSPQSRETPLLDTHHHQKNIFRFHSEPTFQEVDEATWTSCDT